MCKNKKDRTGEVVVNANGVWRIEEYRGSQDITVRLMLGEKDYIVNCQYCQLLNNTLRNPYKHNKYGGYLGLVNGVIPNLKDPFINKCYYLWQNMLERCYSGRYEAYSNVTVCERWHCFANFVEDIPSIPNSGLWYNPLFDNDTVYVFDKDLLQIGKENKIYSKETVVFIPRTLNSKIARGTDTYKDWENVWCTDLYFNEEGDDSKNVDSNIILCNHDKYAS